MKTVHFTIGGKRLTEKEMQILSLLLQLSERWQIAERMAITPGTLKQRLFVIFKKLNVHSQLNAVKFILNNGFSKKGTYRGRWLIQACPPAPLTGTQAPVVKNQKHPSLSGRQNRTFKQPPKVKRVR